MRFFLLFFLLCFSGLSFAQHQDKVDFIHAEAKIRLLPIVKEIKGSVTYTFNVLKNVDSIFLDAKKMKFSSVQLNGEKVKFLNNQKTISIYKKLKARETYKISMSFEAKPKQTVYFIGEVTNVTLSGVKGQVWTQGQGKYTSHWLPSFDDMNEKVEFDLTIIVDSRYKVISNGKLFTKRKGSNEHVFPASDKVKESYNWILWKFNMQKPMSSYLLAFAIGDYNKMGTTSTSGVPIELYYTPKDSLKVEPTYRCSKQIFDFLENEIDVPYPWQNYKQVPVRDFLYAGMENTSTTIFADSYMIDSISFVDKNYVNVNAHELAHQWFGNLVTEVDSNHHWLHEGFATYYAYLAEKEIFGDDHYYWKLYETAKQLDKLSRKGNGEALINPKASSLTFYEKGAWALHMLKEEVGEKAFKLGVKNYLLKHKFKNVTIEDFLNEVRLTSGKDLVEFEKLWLNETDFPYEKVKENLKISNNSLSHFFELQWELTTSSVDNETVIKKYWNKSTSIKFKEAVITTYHKSLSIDFIKEVLHENDLKTRQVFAIGSEKIPSGLKTDFESFLNDKSYITIENALYKLWVHFPEDRINYLGRTKNVIGLPNKNIRLLWLTLAILTKNYDEDKKQDFLKELQQYTAPEYNFEIRQATFQYLNDVFNFTDKNLKDLANACVHHSWQFRKFTRNLLDRLLEDDRNRKRFSLLLPSLNDKEQHYLNSKLNIE